MLYVNPIAEGRIGAATSAAASKERQAQAAEEFERFFLFQLLKEMRKTVPRTELMGKSSQEQMYEEMLDDTLAGEMARSGQLGMAATMQAEFERSTADALRKGSTGGTTPAEGIALHSFRPMPLRASGPESFPITRAAGMRLVKPGQ